MNDVISRNAAITTAKNAYTACRDRSKEDYRDMLIACLEDLPSAQSELIEKAAYIRGFEQGRTQGMIDSQGGKK